MSYPYNNYQDQLVNSVQQLQIDEKSRNSSTSPNPRVPVAHNSKRKRNQHVFMDLGSQATPSYQQYVDNNFDPNEAARTAGIHGSQSHSSIPPVGAIDNTSPYPYPGMQEDVYSRPPQSHYSAPGMGAYSNQQFQQSQPPQFQAPHQHQQQQQFGASSTATTNESVTVPGVRHLWDKHFKTNEFLTFENVSAPPAGIHYDVVDQGNASPEFARMTMYSVPNSEQLRASSRIPLGMVIRPFAETEDLPVPQVDLRKASAVPRCGRCRAYINPGMTHTGYSMTCNICSFTTSVPEEYITEIDSNGLRIDAAEKPEVSKGVVDLLVPEYYNLDEHNPPNSLHYVFLIDISKQSVDTKLREAVCSSIEGLLFDESIFAPGSKFSIIAYDTRLHFFNLSPDLEQATVSIVSDVSDPFLPFFEGMFADPVQSQSSISTTLRHIEQGTQYTGSEAAYGSALLAAKLLLEQVGGGEVISILSRLPTWGPGALALKSHIGRPPTEYERDILTPDNKFYTDLAKEYTKSNIGLNLIVASGEAPVDLMNVGYIANKTGGSVKYFNRFNIDKDEASLFQTIKGFVKQSSGYQGQLKIRCSGGLQVQKYFGPIEETDGMGAPSVPIVSSDTSIACEFEYDGKLSTKKDAHFQAALLYTSKDGIRKVRVINLIMSVTERITDVFNFADQDALLTLLLRQDLSRVPPSNLVAAKSTMTAQLSDIIASYKLLVATNNSLPTQIVLPNGLRTLPTFILAAQKSKALKPSTANPDLRVESFFNLQSFNCSRLSAYLYPLLISLHSLEDDDCENDSITARFNMPQTHILSHESFFEGGAFLVFNGKQLYILLHPNVNPLFLKDLFGESAESLETVNTQTSSLPILDTHLSEQVRNLCLYLADHYNHSGDPFPVRIVRAGIDVMDMAEIGEMLYEDRSPDYKVSSSDFLKTLHGQVLEKEKNGSINAAANNDSVSIGQRFHIF
ncbi:unnamed protein product [Ambrosiozyma monospora]|uniref:Unnamed protein product n=1 Tax=Ambrosiozyma monospora TaxID=43982 RepID=A0A9W6YT44_AMBMO|nr:unnamed protein product [Ambrosiozyma monospora]